MGTWNLEISLAIMMLAVTVAMIVAFQGYLRMGSARRLSRMLMRMGLGGTDLSRQDPVAAATIEEIWKRCRKCQFEGHCERWLNGEVGGDNTFCPNAEAFRALKVANS